MGRKVTNFNDSKEISNQTRNRVRVNELVREGATEYVVQTSDRYAPILNKETLTYIDNPIHSDLLQEMFCTITSVVLPDGLDACIPPITFNTSLMKEQPNVVARQLKAKKKKMFE